LTAITQWPLTQRQEFLSLVCSARRLSSEHEAPHRQRWRRHKCMAWLAGQCREPRFMNWISNCRNLDLWTGSVKQVTEQQKYGYHITKFH